eukprot:TRINITY_DN4576_c0_g1_i1.p2 TRINITY_DN4576_c0_g1~~TRINITY_DN4576_c0_g1_i1.p2  ORF type:complete len:330 (+),score=120.98 TRINITY_DN4576_c0_g1_i1:77-991(+)
MLRLVLVALLAAPAAAAGRAGGGVLAGHGNSTPSAACIAAHCSKQAARCALDKYCRQGMECFAHCAPGNQTCIFQCNSDFEDDAWTSLMRCMFTDNDCTGGMKTFDPYQQCRSVDSVRPMDTYRGQPLTQDQALSFFMRGGGEVQHWMLVGGMSLAYDCFDCQYQWFRPQPYGLEYLPIYRIAQSNGSTRWDRADYHVTRKWPQAGRFSFNASDYGGLFHAEDWRLLAVDEEGEHPQWMAFYYCGGAPGVQEAYEGACIFTPDGFAPSDPAAVAKYNAAFAKAGISLRCYPNNTDCSGAPRPQW